MNTATITRVNTRPDPYGYVTITVAGHRFDVVRDMFDNVRVKGVGSISGLFEELRWAYGVTADLDVARILNGLDRSVARWREDRARIDATL
jgi:hypothetical protein